jgi:hypothetical protein
MFASSAVLSACLDFAVDPNAVLYLAFERLPYPSIVSGDTLRDSSGAATNLTATVVNYDGNQVTDADLRFFDIDDTLNILQVDASTGRVVADSSVPRMLRLIASVGGLQSPPLTLMLTKRPDSLQFGELPDTIEYSFSDTTRNFSDGIAVTILHNDSSTFYSGVASWTVRYSLEQPADTVFATMVDDQNRRLAGGGGGSRHIDTTTSDGRASRKVRVRPGPPLTTSLDSVAILVEASYRGAPLAGSPARLYLYMKPVISP